MVHEPEDIEERAEPFIRGAGLVEIGGELFDAEPVRFFAIAVGERSTRIALRRQRGHPVALGLHLALESLGLLVRCPEPVLEFGQAAHEFGMGRRGSRGAIACGGRLSPSIFQLVPQGLQAPAVFSSFGLSVAMQPVELGP